MPAELMLAVRGGDEGEMRNNGFESASDGIESGSTESVDETWVEMMKAPPDSSLDELMMNCDAPRIIVRA